jgi:hypothetical protein
MQVLAFALHALARLRAEGCQSGLHFAGCLSAQQSGHGLAGQATFFTYSYFQPSHDPSTSPVSTGNLLWRPALAQKVAHQSEQDAFTIEFDRWTTALKPPLSAGSCWNAGVICWLCMTPQLSADGARRSTQDLGHATNAVLMLDQAG